MNFFALTTTLLFVSWPMTLPHAIKTKSKFVLKIRLFICKKLGWHCFVESAPSNHEHIAYCAICDVMWFHVKENRLNLYQSYDIVSRSSCEENIVRHVLES